MNYQSTRTCTRTAQQALYIYLDVPEYKRELDQPRGKTGRGRLDKEFQKVSHGRKQTWQLQTDRTASEYDSMHPPGCGLSEFVLWQIHSSYLGISALVGATRLINII